MILAPTRIGYGLEASLAFQRTDYAIAVVALAWGGIALATLGGSRVAIVVAVFAAAVGFFGVRAIGGNTHLGALAPVMLLAPAALCLAYAVGRRLYVVSAPEKPAQPAAERQVPAVPAMVPASDPDSAPASAPAPDAAPPPSDAAPGAGAADAAAGAARSVDAAAEAAAAAASTGERQSLAEILPPVRATEAELDAAERLRFLRMRASEAGATGRALTLWRELIEEYPDYYPAMNAEARVLAQTGKLDAARRRLAQSLEIAPQDASTLRLAARYAGNAEDWQAAAEYWKQAFEAGELNADSAAAYINALIRADRAADGRAIYHRHAERWPEEARFVAAGALAAETAGDDAEAYELWRAASALDPAAFSHRRRAVRALLRLERFGEAARLAQETPPGDGGEAEAKALTDHVLATVNRQGGRTAVEALNILAPKDPAAWTNLIRRQLTADDVDGAEMSFQRAIENENDAVDVLRMGAAIAEQAKRQDLQAERWAAIAESAPDDVNANLQAALLAAREQAHDDVLAFAGRVLAQTPDYEAASALVGEAFIQKQDWRPALDAWKGHGARFGLSPKVTARCAEALRGLGRDAEAERFLQAGIAAFPDSQELAVLFARAAQIRREYELAIDRWKAAIILNAAAEAPWSGLIFSLMRDGRHEGARAALAEARRRVENEAVLMASSHIQQLQTEEPTGGAT